MNVQSKICNGGLESETLAVFSVTYLGEDWHYKWICDEIGSKTTVEVAKITNAWMGDWLPEISYHWAAVAQLENGSFAGFYSNGFDKTVLWPLDTAAEAISVLSDAVSDIEAKRNLTKS